MNGELAEARPESCSVNARSKGADMALHRRSDSFLANVSAKEIKYSVNTLKLIIFFLIYDDDDDDKKTS